MHTYIHTYVHTYICTYVHAYFQCYGEFVEDKEPTHVGADLIAGSLIKNPGGTLAPSGAYIAGKDKYVKAAFNRYGCVLACMYVWMLLFLCDMLLKKKGS